MFAPRAAWRTSQPSSGMPSPAADSPISDAIVNGTHGVNRVGLVRSLVFSITNDSREAQRHARRTPGARLPPVKPDLDDQLRPHVDGPPIVSNRKLAKMISLPAKHLVGQSLESLSQHDEFTGGRIESAQMEIGQPALATPMATFDRQNHEVE